MFSNWLVPAKGDVTGVGGWGGGGLRPSFMAGGEGKGLRPLRKSRGESGLHLNAGQSVELPCYYGAQWGRVQRRGGLEVAAGPS